MDDRSTAEALRHEKLLFLADAGPYAGARDKRARLAERMEELIASVHSRWSPRARAAEGRAGE